MHQVFAYLESPNKLYEDIFIVKDLFNGKMSTFSDIV